MSSLYIANTGTTGSRGIWYGNSAIRAYSYESFIPGEDVNLDRISLYVYPYTDPPITYTAPTSFQVSLYADSAVSTQPGSFIASLNGPSQPIGEAYNNYVPSSPISLASGTKYWLGFELSSPTSNGSDTRVRIGANSGGFSTLGSGWSVPNHIAYRNGAIDNLASPLMYSLYAAPVCFLEGTKILMADGSARSIEKIEPGELVSTSKGSKKTKWVARQTISPLTAGQEGYIDALPIIFMAGSLGKNMPYRDLYLSPSHEILVDRMVIPAQGLINGSTIRKTTWEELPNGVRYFHLEFDNEVLIDANGCLACSYIESGNRRSFDNYPEYLSLHSSMHSKPQTRVPRPKITRSMLKAWTNQRLISTNSITQV